ncbi:metallopeptidase family protein [Nakamurella antarctica]|uniref:Metallopeptidase family protein n=1 Tax=Nakamurella antarctica TaxID=1902245 RepID=A0A3G8ZMY7_9ACTN|nr:metallopeptidase family protein [Nakamurella antarctica]AZI58508.1 metallopeptidase family protein [Nakamurella antarctica]
MTTSGTQSGGPRAVQGDRVRRDRRGRGLRTPLLPADLPAARSRAEQFDQVVLSAVSALESRWPTELSTLEFAVDEVPIVSSEAIAPATDVILDGSVPLARFFAPGVDKRGKPTKARVVLYRRPLEVRAGDPSDLGDLVEEVLAEQVAAILGEPESEPEDEA